MPSLLFWLLVIAFILAVMPNSAYAFGAGNVPSYGYLEHKAFRHGDIEDVLTEILKRASSGMLSSGSKFKGLDVKRVYFGNWLRDYSQAVDVAGLKATSIQNILTICTVLGFLAHGFVTDEFEVTEARLGVYLPTEHIDNPKGYPDDARNFHPKLRGPVDPRELEIDLRTGMKNYIANEDGHWDTSKALIRRRLLECIDMGRKYRASSNKAEQYEAFRLLGTAMHTMEDFPAHSNFCELALVAMGHTQVFTHVGDQVRIPAPSGRMVPPLVTGTFGGDDFQHSLLGEAGDHISQSSISDLNDKMNTARSKSASGDFGSAAKIKSLISSIPSSDNQSMSRDIDAMQANRAGSTTAAGAGKTPEQMTPQELYANIWGILKFRDSVVKKISYGIEKVPGLGPLIDSIMENITVYVFQMLEPYLKPLMKTATTQLAASSATVINKLDQFEVFHDPVASDPTHSMLSKDHFNLILNEPAGNLAKIIVINTVKLVVHAWDNPSDNAHQVVETCLECLFHPDFHNPRSVVQQEMMKFMRTWINSHSAGMHGVLARLTKEAVRKHENVRAPGDASAPTVSASSHGHGVVINTSYGTSAKITNAMSHIPGASHLPHLPPVPGVAQAQGMMHQVQGYMGGGGGGHFPSRDMPGPPGGGYAAPAHPPHMPDPSRDFPSGSGHSYSQPHGAPSYQQGYGQSHEKDKGHKKKKSKDSDSDSSGSDKHYGGGYKPKKEKKDKDKHKKDKHDKHDKHGYSEPSFPAHSPPAGGPGRDAPGGYPGAASSGYPGSASSPGYPGAASSGYPGAASSGYPGTTPSPGYPGASSYAAPPPPSSGYPASPTYGGPPGPGYGPPSSFPSPPPPPGGAYGGAPGYPGYGGPSPPTMPYGNAPPAPYGGPNMPGAPSPGYPGAPPSGYPGQQGPGYPGQPSYPGQPQPPYGGWQ